MLGSVLPELAVRSIVPCFDGEVVAATFAESIAARSKSRLLLWNTSDFTPQAESATPIPQYQPLADQVECLVGAYGHGLVFLHQDGWICSADSLNFDVEYYDRHFFVPTDWLSTTGNLMLGIFRNGNIVFVQRDELVVIRRGLEHFEQGQSRGNGKRPSLTRTMVSDSAVDAVSSKTR
ncbi:hypothetical protein EPUS_05636 [Endocarpon pusillum Z07020]|uniref:CNH domain-containing protein n=1 Tax=Endocarpon pusillum (strain Z07020 / HMAS-L-300199) TaxID=1263415 RepID=U1FUL2_ENDPU|nr:uncharacterized protein EPUS_05636 [Endocarpon pusillum Z07020]ERF68497.1 hypothetical protein EPUS_05636 [Endocarpon pusillum Z07020]